MRNRGHLVQRKIRWLQRNIREHKLLRQARRPGKKGEDTVLIMVYSLGGGGAERVASILANELNKYYRICVICNERKEKQYALATGVELLIADFREEAQRLRMIRLIKENRHVKASVSLMYAMNRLNVETMGTGKTICSERNNPMRREPEHFSEIERLYEKADHVVFQSAAVQNLFTEQVISHSIILPNPVTVSCVCKTERRHRIVNVGRLHPQKNQKMLLRAFQLFYRTHPEYTLSFYGIGELRQELENLACRLGIQDVVFFHGQADDIHAQIADAEMFVLSSDFEGLSNALLECMMMGMACISTACEGSVDVIQSGEDGILVPVGDAKALANAMIDLADNPVLRMQIERKAMQSAERFRKENVIRQWIDLIES